MSQGKTEIREAVVRSLSAIGAIREAQFYVDVFKSQEPERFALIVIDPRCLKNPLLESLVSNIRILSDLGLYPTLLIGALDHDSTSVRFQSQRLSKELESVSVRTSKLNVASYGLVPEIKSKTARGRVPILELIEQNEKYNLTSLALKIRPNKIIFLQPSGGLSLNGNRVPVIDIDNASLVNDLDPLSIGQKHFFDTVTKLDSDLDYKSVYVIASPLNLLSELFTTKGSGTLLRRSAGINYHTNIRDIDYDRLIKSVETAFGKELNSAFESRAIKAVLVDKDYRSGAIMMQMSNIPYLSKFWVQREVRGEGMATDIWKCLIENEPRFYWRSREGNPFNDWYMRQCEGMQMNKGWRVFWRGLATKDISVAILSASNAPDDFVVPGEVVQEKLF